MNKRIKRECAGERKVMEKEQLAECEKDEEAEKEREREKMKIRVKKGGTRSRRKDGITSPRLSQSLCDEALLME